MENKDASFDLGTNPHQTDPVMSEEVSPPEQLSGSTNKMDIDHVAPRYKMPNYGT